MLTLACLCVVATADLLTWTDPVSGYSYDWSALQQPEESPWMLEEPDPFFASTKYYFNFGRDVPTQCGSLTAAVVEVMDFDFFMETCDILGRHEMTAVRLFKPNKPEKGVVVTYKGGDVCGLGGGSNRMTAVFQLVCSETETVWELLSDEFVDPCHLVVRKYTAQGCPTNSGFGSTSSLLWWAIILNFAGLLAYFLVGSLVKCCQGARGIEALPHHEFWCRLPLKFWETLRGTSKSSNNKNYELV